MRIILSALFIYLSFSVSAQRIYGTIYNVQGDLLPYSSITVKGTSKGTSSNNKANYSLSLSPGTYTLICQHIGYSAQEKEITISTDKELTFILIQQKLVMKEVVIKSRAEDPAYEIIRQAIKKRSYYNDQLSDFSCDIYGKDVLKLRKLPKKMLGKKIKEEDRKEMGVDSAGKGILYLSESLSTAYKQGPSKFKLEVKSSRVSGSGSFGFAFPSFISLYNNNVTIFTERFNPRGFISPIADGAIHFYKYKYLGSFYENGKEINSIRVTPRRTYEPLFTGIINITEADWRIHSFDLMLTKTAQLEIMDTLQLTQLHVPVSDDIWRTKNQLLHFNFKFLGIDAIGNFLNVYSNYNITPAFNKNFFDRIVIKYDTAVNKRSVAYWDSARAVPLETEELNDYLVKDSIYQRNKDSLFSRQNIDSLKKRQGKLKLLPVFISGIHRTHYSKTNQYSWGINPLILNSEYNTAEGIAVNLNGYISKRFNRSRKEISFEPAIRYGFHNGHLNPSAGIIINSFNNDPDVRSKHYVWKISGGKRVSEFNKESDIHPLKNTLRILLTGNNFMKTYENYFAAINYSRNFESGWRFNINTTWEDRIPLENTVNYTFRKKDKINITPNYPYLRIPSQFQPHQALLISVDVAVKPGQRFIQLPNAKIPIGSKYPTFSINYTKGLQGILGSDVNFDKVSFAVNDDKNLKLLGKLMYKVGVGGFINNRSVYIQDYKHFNRNSGFLNSFQLAEFYTHSTISSFYFTGHIEHHFNGLLTNKIPIFKRLNWNLVAGSNWVFVNSNNNYTELFAGFENIFKVLRVDAVAGYEPGKPVLTGIRISAGGLIGNRTSAKTSQRGNSVTITL
ncbi:MAG: DUF5686 and carboxypeptidase regulatory-like domain-containing protein [Ferruginibacter sp.]